MLGPLGATRALSPEEALRPGALNGDVIHLHVSDQHIKDVSAVFDALAETKVRALRLEVSGRSLPERVGSLRNLRSLHVSGHGLAGLPSSLGELQRLELLRVEAFHLLSLPKRLRRLRRLRALYVDSHHLLRLPAGLGELTSLRALGLVLRRDWAGDWGKDFLFPPRFEQPIADVIQSLSALPELELLYLGEPITTTSWSSFGGGASRTFHELPEALGELSALKSLGLYETSAVSLPGSLRLSSALERVVLRGRSSVVEPGPLASKLVRWRDGPLW